MADFDPKDDFEALFNRNYLRWFDLQGTPALIEIKKVEKNVELTLPGGAKKKSPVMHFKLVNGKIENVKPLVLNKTNAGGIAKIHGRKPSEWAGKEIVLYESITDVYDHDIKRMKKTPCIRIREKKK